jgi:Flp pilus assembly protein CpaB
MTYRVRNIGIAVALAAVAALLTSFYVTSYKRHVQSGQDQVTVYVAKQDIAQGTTGAAAAKLLSTEQVPKRTVIPGAITKPDQLTGLVATERTMQGEQVTTRRFSTVSRNGVRAELSGTMRAFQFAGNDDQVLAGTLRAGDHVDLVATLECGNDCEFSRVVLRNMKVLQAPSAPATGTKLTGSSSNFSVMLAMTDSQTQKFQHVLSNRSGDTTGAGWHLSLRPPVHDADSPESVTTVWTILRDGLSPAWINRYLSRLRGGK